MAVLQASTSSTRRAAVPTYLGMPLRRRLCGSPHSTPVQGLWWAYFLPCPNGSSPSAATIGCTSAGAHSAVKLACHSTLTRSPGLAQFEVFQYRRAACLGMPHIQYLVLVILQHKGRVRLCGWGEGGDRSPLSNSVLQRQQPFRWPALLQAHRACINVCSRCHPACPTCPLPFPLPPLTNSLFTLPTQHALTPNTWHCRQGLPGVRSVHTFTSATHGALDGGCTLVLLGAPAFTTGPCKSVGSSTGPLAHAGWLWRLPWITVAPVSLRSGAPSCWIDWVLKCNISRASRARRAGRAEEGCRGRCIPRIQSLWRLLLVVVRSCSDNELGHWQSGGRGLPVIGCAAGREGWPCCVAVLQACPCVMCWHVEHIASITHHI